MKSNMIKAVLQLTVIALTISLMSIVHRHGGLFHMIEGIIFGTGWVIMNVVEMRFSTPPQRKEDKDVKIINMSFTKLAESDLVVTDRELCRALLVFKDRMDEEGNIMPKPPKFPGVIPPPNTKVYLN